MLALAADGLGAAAALIRELAQQAGMAEALLEPVVSHTCSSWGTSSPAPRLGKTDSAARAQNKRIFLIGLGRDTLGRMEGFSSVLLPVMAVLTAATGNVTSGQRRQGAE